MAWTKLMKFRHGNIVNGRRVDVESQSGCYYRYIIHDGEEPDWLSKKYITSDWKYTSALGAFSAGKSAAKKMTSEPPKENEEIK